MFQRARPTLEGRSAMHRSATLVGAAAMSMIIGAIPIASIGAEVEPSAAVSDGTGVTRTDILPGVPLVVEEVEPGLLKVVGDGIRDLSDRSIEPAFDGITAGLDGSVWLFRRDEFFRLGDAETHRWGSGSGPPPFGVRFRTAHVLVDTDGTLWRATPTRFMYDGARWKTPRIAGRKPSGCGSGDRRMCVMSIAASADGSVWLTLDERGERVRIARRRDGTWRTWPGFEQIDDSGIIVGASDSGEVFLIEEPNEDTELAWLNSTSNGHDWQVTVDIAGVFGRVGSADWDTAAVGPDGTLWMDFGERLARRTYDEGEDQRIWNVVPSPGIGVGNGICGLSYACDLMEVAPDGTLWAGLADRRTCAGLGHVTTSGSTTYLDGACVRGLDIAPDGTVWIQATETDGPLETFVIAAPDAGRAE